MLRLCRAVLDEDHATAKTLAKELEGEASNRANQGTESQASSDRASIPAQRAINRRTASAYGLNIVRSIEMSDVSGAAVLKAPEIQELLTLMEDVEIHGVIAREFSRLMRPEDFGDYALLQAFADTKTILYLPEGPIDFASKTGRLMGTIRAAIAGMERTEILERIWGAKEEKRRAGGFAQAKICLPFGVDYPWAYTADSEKVREAFRLFLAGETSYMELGRKVGIEAFNLRNILRNPIYTGWRVIDKKRDTSPAGKYATKNGRQGDRRKIKRAPEDVIRVKVLDPLISESNFQQVQRMIELKKSRRTKPVSRFTYNGFLCCALCNGIISTKFRRADYYVCKARHVGHTCSAGYMRREVFEPKLDQLFTKRLTDPRFLKRIVKGMKKMPPQANLAQLSGQLDALTGKRQRVLDTYFEGVITRAERDTRLAAIDRERQVTSDLLARERPNPKVETDTLVQLFSVFAEFDLLERTDKRALLATITPEILVADYEISGLFFSLDANPTDRDS